MTLTHTRLSCRPTPPLLKSHRPLPPGLHLGRTQRQQPESLGPARLRASRIGAQMQSTPFPPPHAFFKKKNRHLTEGFQFIPAPPHVFLLHFSPPFQKNKKSPRALRKWGCPFAMLLRAAEIPSRRYVRSHIGWRTYLPGRSAPEGRSPGRRAARRAPTQPPLPAWCCRQSAALKTLSSSCPGSWSSSLSRRPPVRLRRPLPAPAGAAAAVGLQPPPRRCLSAALCSAGASAGGGS